MDWQQAQNDLISRLASLYDGREAAVITDWVMESLSGRKKIERLFHKTEPLSPEQEKKLAIHTDELLRHRPVQYVLQEAWLGKLKFFVDENVLIPRPETEELVEWVTAVVAHDQTATDARPTNLTILDVGTGSGCIAISLKKNLPLASVYACDLSEKALAIAARNAADLGADIQFRQLDFLDRLQWEALSSGSHTSLPTVDYLVSNPPYIPLKEKASMGAHVTQFEPHLALFVDDADPLVFYRALAGFAQRKLNPGGAIFAEIHEESGKQVEAVFRQNGFQQVTLRKDMQGKERMIKARYAP
jgi:release factor glutamine methyltransferase